MGRSVFAKSSKALKTIVERDKRIGEKVSIIIKGDVDGSIDAIRNSLASYDESNVDLDIMLCGVGDVTETDLKLAHEFDGIIYAFNIRVSDVMHRAASSLYEKAVIREHNVIYALMDDLIDEINQKMPQEDSENENNYDLK